MVGERLHKQLSEKGPELCVNTSPCLAFCCSDKDHDQKQHVEERVCLILQFQATVHHWGKSGWELKQDKNLEAGTKTRRLRAGLIPVACSASSAYILIHLKTPVQGWLPPPRPAAHQSVIKITAQDCCRPVWWRLFLLKFSPPVCLWLLSNLQGKKFTTTTSSLQNGNIVIFTRKRKGNMR